jgi:hypothetical protein
MVRLGGYFFPFCDVAEMAISIRWFSQIWPQTRYEITKKIRILLYSWLPTGTYHKNLAIWKLSFFRNLTNLGHFFPWKILCIGQSHIFQVEIWGNFAQKKKHWVRSKWCPNQKAVTKENFAGEIKEKGYLGTWFQITGRNMDLTPSMCVRNLASLYFKLTWIRVAPGDTGSVRGQL